MRGFLAIVLVSSLGAMQKKAKFTGEVPALVGVGPLMVYGKQKEGTQKVIASGSFVTSLNVLKEWEDLKTKVKETYPNDQRVWDSCERDLYRYIDERSRYSEVGGVFDRAKEAFKVIAEVISVSKETIEKALKNENMQQRRAEKAFAKHLCDYIEEVLREALLKPTDSIDTIAQRFFARWFEQWQKIYRLKIRHKEAVKAVQKEAVKNIKAFSQEIALGEMLTFAFVALQDYQDVKEKFEVENKQTDEQFQLEESLKLPLKIEKEIARRIVHNYCAFRGKMPARDEEEMLKELEQPTRAHELIERIRLLPVHYESAREEFNVLFKALKDGKELPPVASKKQEAVLSKVEMNTILNLTQDLDIEKRIEAFAQYSLVVLDKIFASSERGSWFELTILVGLLKRRAVALFADNARVSWLFQNYLSVVLALHRYAFIIMADETLSQEKHKQIIKAIDALRTKFLKDSLTIYRRDSESLKLYVENCLVQDLNKELGGFLGVAESLGAELELGQKRGKGASVYQQDYLFGRAESSHSDPLFGIVGNIPPSISDLLPQGLEFYHLTVGAQAGSTCFYQAVVNARVLEDLIKAGHAVSGKALRDGAKTYEAVIKKACEQESDEKKNAQQEFFEKYGPKQKLISQHLWKKGAELFQDKNYSGSFRFDEALKFAVENLNEKRELGVVNILCIYNDPESTGYNHAFVLSFVKLKKDDPVRLLYMESNNLYLEEKGEEGTWWIRFLKALPVHLKHIIDIVRDELALP
jgi:hypothetical protein